MIKVLWWSLQRCLALFTMLLVDVLSETGIFRHLSHYFFVVRKIVIEKFLRVIFFSKCSEFNVDFKNGENNSEICLCFWDNCILIGMIKFSLLRTSYLSLSDNFGVRNFGNTKAMRVIFFTKRSKFQLDFENAAKFEKNFCDFRKISSELVSLTCLY